MNTIIKLKILFALTITVTAIFSMISIQPANAGQWVYYDYADIDDDLIQDEDGDKILDPNTQEVLAEWSYSINENCIYGLPSDPYNEYGDLWITSTSNTEIYGYTPYYAGGIYVEAISDIYSEAEMGYEWEGPGTSQYAHFWYNFGGQSGAYGPSDPCFPYYIYDVMAIHNGQTPAEVFIEFGSGSLVWIEPDWDDPYGLYIFEGLSSGYVNSDSGSVFVYSGGPSCDYGPISGSYPDEDNKLHYYYTWAWTVESGDIGVTVDAGETLISLKLGNYIYSYAYSDLDLDQEIRAQVNNFNISWGNITNFYGY